jgi:dihydroneopterin aldolase
MSPMTELRVLVRHLEVEARIGVHPHELDIPQPLIVDIALEIAPGSGPRLETTVDYERLADHARSLAAEGHIGLVETYARRLAEACLSEPRALAVTIRVDKPRALAPAMAGVEVRMTKNKLAEGA